MFEQALGSFVRDQRPEVVPHDVGVRHMGGRRDEVATEEQGRSAVGDLRKLLGRRVAVANDHLNSGEEFALAVDEFEAVGLVFILMGRTLQRQYVQRDRDRPGHPRNFPWAR